jgi:hypothetical protein
LDPKEKPAFEKLKACLANLPELALPYDRHTDASDVGIGAVFTQQGRPVVFASRTFSSAEANYSTTEKQLLAVVWTFSTLHPCSMDPTLTVYTDHAAFKSILSTKSRKEESRFG